MILWIIGFLMVLAGIALEFTVYKPTLQGLQENPKKVIRDIPGIGCNC